ncbi:hypothetical protein [Sphingomonas sp. VNH70]
MAKIAPGVHPHRSLEVDPVPNATGLVLCMIVAVPIWAGILALIF